MWKWAIVIFTGLGCKIIQPTKKVNARTLMATNLISGNYNLSQLTAIVKDLQSQIDSQQMQIDSLKKGVVLLDTAHIFKIDSMGNVTFRDSLIYHGVFSVTGAIYLAPDSLHVTKNDTTSMPQDTIPLPPPVDTTGHGGNDTLIIQKLIRAN